MHCRSTTQGASERESPRTDASAFPCPEIGHSLALHTGVPHCMISPIIIVIVAVLSRVIPCVRDSPQGTGVNRLAVEVSCGDGRFSRSV